MLTGGAGADTFVYKSADQRGDTITDFEVGRDKFELSKFFSTAKYGSVNVFNDYIKIVGTGEGAKVKIDLLGDSGDQFKTLATLTGVGHQQLKRQPFCWFG